MVLILVKDIEFSVRLFVFQPPTILLLGLQEETPMYVDGCVLSISITNSQSQFQQNHLLLITKTRVTGMGWIFVLEIQSSNFKFCGFDPIKLTRKMCQKKKLTRKMLVTTQYNKIIFIFSETLVKTAQYNKIILKFV
jgi:hypothetical protein